MCSELGRIEKPEAEQFKGQRKIYLVPLIFAPRQPTKDYAELYERYWSGVREHLLKLEGRIGSIARVYHEAVGLAGEEGLAEAEKLNEKSASIARGKVDAGAVFEAVEDEDLVTETFDWQRCLMVGLENKKVADLVWGHYNEAVRKRYEVMAKRIDETLKPEEAGLLFISEDHRVQFPTDIRVFYVAPPALDEIHRWIRDQRSQAKQEGE
ncbi:MAG: hypothetical protein ACOX87_09730 [Chloroflexota bacterium]|jgi:hypothetical protein